MKYTFFYVVGGDDKYYQQLYKSLRSLSRLKSNDFKVKILDFDNKFNFQSNIKIELVNLDYKIDKKETFWQYKYFICQNIDTEYGIYLDCDTVVCYDRLNDIEQNLGDSFGVIPHFFIRNFHNFSYIFNNFNFPNLTQSDEFFTGGVFCFHNNQRNIQTLKEIYNLHDQLGTNQSLGLYDETFLSMALSKRDFVKFNGSYNHCSANLMPLESKEQILIGKNDFDEDSEPIFVLHGSSERQFDGQDFTGETKKMVQDFWNI